MEHETFWTLLQDGAHWQFEIFLILLVDGLIGAIIWPFLKRIYSKNPHHESDDKKIAALETKVAKLEEQLSRLVNK